MTRGKHSVSATARHAIAERDSEIDMYRKNVSRLTAENKDLERQLKEREEAHRREVRRLKAELNEGISPELLVLRRENRRLRDEMPASKAAMREWSLVLRRVFFDLINHYKELHVGGQPEDSFAAIAADFPTLWQVIDGNRLVDTATSLPTGPRVRGKR